MPAPESESCARCGTRLVRFLEDDGKPRVICPRCEADQIASLYEKEPEPGGPGPGRKRRPRTS